MLNEQQQNCLSALGLSQGTKQNFSNSPLAFEFTAKNDKYIQSHNNKPIAPPVFEVIKPNKTAPKHQPKTKTNSIAPKEIKDLNDWQQLSKAISACQFCAELSQVCQQPIVGMGNNTADLLIISEAPSSDEDLNAQPFVGSAGQLFDNMLKAIKLNRDEIYTTHIIKCQPPNSRDPHKDESIACEPFIKAQIKLIQPKLILALGRIAAHQLLDVKTPVGQLRGTTHSHQTGIPIIVSYHPAYLLRNKNQKQSAWQDLIRVNDLLND